MAGGGALVLTGVTQQLDARGDAAAVAEFLKQAKQVRDERVEGLLWHVEALIGDSFVLERAGAGDSALSVKVVEQLDQVADHDYLFLLSMALSGHAILVNFAGEEGLEHLAKEHLGVAADFSDGFCFVEHPVVILRVDSGMWFFVSQDSDLDSKGVRDKITHLFKEHYDSDGEVSESCSHLEVTVFEINGEDHATFEKRLPQWKPIHEWAERCEAWYAKKYLN